MSKVTPPHCLRWHGPPPLFLWLPRSGRDPARGTAAKQAPAPIPGHRLRALDTPLPVGAPSDAPFDAPFGPGDGAGAPARQAQPRLRQSRRAAGRAPCQGWVARAQIATQRPLRSALLLYSALCTLRSTLCTSQPLLHVARCTLHVALHAHAHCTRLHTAQASVP